MTMKLSIVGIGADLKDHARNVTKGSPVKSKHVANLYTKASTNIYLTFDCLSLSITGPTDSNTV